LSFWNLEILCPCADEVSSKELGRRLLLSGTAIVEKEVSTFGRGFIQEGQSCRVVCAIVPKIQRELTSSVGVVDSIKETYTVLLECYIVSPLIRQVFFCSASGQQMDQMLATRCNMVAA
jgi:hypothetical protein